MCERGGEREKECIQAFKHVDSCVFPCRCGCVHTCMVRCAWFRCVQACHYIVFVCVFVCFLYLLSCMFVLHAPQMTKEKWLSISPLLAYPFLHITQNAYQGIDEAILKALVTYVGKGWQGNRSHAPSASETTHPDTLSAARDSSKLSPPPSRFSFYRSSLVRR